MIIAELRHLLESNSESSLRFMLPSSQLIPAEFHITEVGRIDKTFIDCGGTQRQSAACLLQAWTANDLDHRLVAGKFAKILQLAEPVLRSVDLPVEVEYGPDVAAQYSISDVEITPNRLLFILSGKQTDCLARDKCGIEPCGSSGCCG